MMPLGGAANEAASSKVPVDTPALFRIGIIPGDGTLIAGIHARTALNAVLELENDLTFIIILIAFCRTDIGRAVVRTDRIANVGVDENMRSGFGAPLIAVGNHTKTFGKGALLHSNSFIRLW